MCYFTAIDRKKVHLLSKLVNIRNTDRTTPSKIKKSLWHAKTDTIQRKKKQGSSHTPFSFQKRYPLDLHVLYLFPFLPPSDKVRAITPSVTNFYFPSPIYLQIQKAISTE